MGAPVLPPGRSTPNDLPKWLAFEPRERFTLCDCVQVAGGRHYARAACGTCRGAGIVRPRPILSAHELELTTPCDGADAPGEG